jgi:hypothetical protein
MENGGARLIRPPHCETEDWKNSMPDVSLELSSVCIVDASGRIVRETKIPSEPERSSDSSKDLAFPVTRIGLEAGPLSQWLHASLVRAGFETVLSEARHVKAALSAMSVKTDRNPHGLVPPRTRQVSRLARGASIACRTQAAPFETYGS